MGLPEFTAALKRELNRSPLNQSTLAAAAGVTQGMVNAWLQGQVQKPDLDKVADVERALDLAPGFLTQHLGWVPHKDGRPIDVKSAVEADPLLDRVDKDAMRGLYNILRRRSADSDTVSDAPPNTARKSRTAPRV